MTDDFDHTQELPPGSAGGGYAAGQSGRGYNGGRGPVGPGQAGPSPSEISQSGAGAPGGWSVAAGGGNGYGAGNYTPSPQGYAQPGSATVAAEFARGGRGSSGFSVAVVGAVVATVLVGASAFVGHQINASTDSPTSSLGTIKRWLEVLPWPWGSDLQGSWQTAFIAGAIAILVVSFLVLLPAAVATRPGSGAFALLLSGWMATVLAGAVASILADWAVNDWTWYGVFVRSGVSVGASWGLVTGWIVGLVTAFAQSARRTS